MNMNKITKILWAIIFIIGGLFLVWFVGSYFEIISKNLSPNPVYWKYNLFQMIVRG